VLKDLLDNRKQRILSTIRNSEELRRGTLEQLEKARIRLQKVKDELWAEPSGGCARKSMGR